jgi:hypothetical protein
MQAGNRAANATGERFEPRLDGCTGYEIYE